MSLAEVWAEFARCDIVIEQLATGAIGGAGLDAMAAGRPVIGNARREMFEDYFGQHSPICQAQTAEEVCAQLKRLVSNPAKREKIGMHGRRFVEEHCSPQHAAQTCLERLQPANSDQWTGTGHRYYLQRCYDDRKALLCSQQVLHTTQVELQTTQHTLHTAQAELETCRQTLHTTQAELQTTQHTLHTAQAELEAYRQTLHTTQADLQTFQHTLQAAQAELEAYRQTLHTTQAELQTTQAKLARYEDFLPIQVARKLRRLVKNRK